MTRNVFNKLLLPLALLSTFLPAKADRLVYFGTSQSEGIYTAEFDSEIGSLTPISLAAEIASPGFLATHPNQQYLYYYYTCNFKQYHTITLTLKTFEAIKTV